MNRILSYLIELLGEAFPIANPSLPAGAPLFSPRPASFSWRRVFGIAFFLLLAALPFLAMCLAGGE